ncbi:MAG: ribonuclease HI family protein [Candidatus Aenigmarchaeota archaeon]|nr:ribonuclease HI family protein [Candidatus Aenigmarchaeota archaeon]
MPIPSLSSFFGKKTGANRGGKISVYTDAGSRGNPGPAAIAYSVYDSSGSLLEEGGSFIGTCTNNTAEYSAMIAALQAASKFSNAEVSCFSDSEIMVRQLNMKYRVKERHLKVLFDKVRRAEANFKRVTYTHLRRESPKISRMDAIVNKTLDERSK